MLDDSLCRGVAVSISFQIAEIAGNAVDIIGRRFRSTLKIEMRTGCFARWPGAISVEMHVRGVLAARQVDHLCFDLAALRRLCKRNRSLHLCVLGTVADVTRLNASRAFFCDESNLSMPALMGNLCNDASQPMTCCRLRIDALSS
jgi:hypothetical protein